MRIAVCTLAVGDDFRSAVLPAQLSKQLYCQQHGYQYIEETKDYDNTRPIAWSKVIMLQRYLPQFDYLVWIDADALIMNFDHTLEDKIDRLMDNKDQMVLSDWKMINTGVWFLKNSLYNIEFLEKLYNQTDFINSANWEQDAFIHLHQTDSEFAGKLKVLNHSYEKDIQAYWYAYHYGFFILHFAGYRGRTECLRRDIRRYCTIRLPEEYDDTELEKRIFYLKNGHRDYVHKQLG